MCTFIIQQLGIHILFTRQRKITSVFCNIYTICNSVNYKYYVFVQINEFTVNVHSILYTTTINARSAKTIHNKVGKQVVKISLIIISFTYVFIYIFRNFYLQTARECDITSCLYSRQSVSRARHVVAVLFKLNCHAHARKYILFNIILIREKKIENQAVLHHLEIYP